MVKVWFRITFKALKRMKGKKRWYYERNVYTIRRKLDDEAVWIGLYNAVRDYPIRILKVERVS